MVFQGSKLFFSWLQVVFYGYSRFQGGFSRFQVGIWFSRFQVGFLLFQVGLYGFSGFQVRLSWFQVGFHGSWLVFMVPDWFFIVLGQFS